MLKFVAQFRRWEGIFLISRERIKEVFNVVFVNKPPAFIDRKEFVKVEGVIGVFIVNFSASINLGRDGVG